MGAIWRRAGQTSFGSSYGNYFYFITSLIFAQVTSEYRFTVLAPDTHVAMSTEVDVEYSIPTQAELENAVIEVYDILNSSVARVAPVPVGIHDGHMNFSCAIFDHAGGFLFKLLLEESGPILVESDAMDVVWQDFYISVPTSHEAMTGEVQVGVRTDGEVCGAQPRRFRTHFVVKYLGTNDTVDQSVTPSIVATQTLDILSQETHVTVSCESLDQAGLYRVELRSEFNDSLIASSQDFPVKWSENYALSTEKLAIFPCQYVVDVSFYTPACHGHDRVRLYRQGAGLAGQASDQLEYVTEQRIRPGKTFVQFTCSEFDPSFPVYCFKYVSIARRGAVTEQATLCLPSQYSAPAIDGNWGSWEPWSTCPVTCGEGRIQRFRVCNNPPPSNGGAFCEGETLESGTCQGLPPCPAEDLGTLPPLTVRPVATDNCACGCTLRDPLGGVTRPPYGACAGVVTWLIWVLEDYRIRLEFEVFDLDKTQERIKIRDGGEATSPLLFSSGSVDPPATLTSSGSRLYIEFRVQADLQAYSTRGFTAGYSSFQLVPSTTAVTTTAVPEEPLTWWQKVEKFFKLEIFQNPVTVAGIVLCALVVIGSIIAVICTRMCRRRKRTAAYAASSAQSEIEGGGTQSPRSLSLNHIEATSVGAQSQRSGRDRREHHLSDMSMSDLSHTSRRKPMQNGKVPTGYANHIYSASAPETPQRFTNLGDRPASPVQGQFPTPYQLAQEQLKLMRQHGLDQCEQLYDFSMAGPPMEAVVPSPYTGALPSNVPGNAYFHPIQQPYSVQETTFTQQAASGPENYSNNNAHVYILDPRFENQSPTHSNKEKRKSRSPIRDSKSPKNSPNKRQLPVLPKPHGRKLPVTPRPAFYADQEVPAAGLAQAAVTASDPQLAHETRRLRREKSEKKSLTPNVSRRGKNRVEKFVYQPSPYNSLDRAMTTRHSKRSSKHRSKGSVKKSRTTENFAAQVHSPSEIPSSTDGMRSSQEIKIRGPSERRKGHGHSHRLGSQGSLGKASSKTSKEELYRSSREQLPKYPGPKTPDRRGSEKGQTSERSLETAQVVERRESSPEHKKPTSNPPDQRKSLSPDRKSPQKSLDLRKLGNEHSLYEQLGLNDKKPKTGRRLAHYAAQSEDSRSQFSSEGSSAYAMTMTQKLFHFDDSERDQYRTSIGPVGETVFEDLRRSADLDDVVTPNGHVISSPTTDDAKSPSNGDVISNHSRRQLPRTPSLEGRKTPHDQVFVDKTPDPEYDYYMPDLPGSFLKMDQTYIGRPKPITTNQTELKNIQVQLESCPPDAVRM